MSTPTIFVGINVSMVGTDQFEVWVGNDLRGTYTSRERAEAVAKTYVEAEGKKVVVPSSKFEPKGW